MRKAEYKQTGEKIEEYEVNIPAEYDEEGNVVVEEHTEIRTRTVPIMEMVYRDMTEEEIAELDKAELDYWKSVDYEEAVDNEIRKKYSASAEFAILRQKEEKPDEYASYYAYCEECKAYVKGMIKECDF
jgi:hypothetical protein